MESITISLTTSFISLFIFRVSLSKYCGFPGVHSLAVSMRKILLVLPQHAGLHAPCQVDQHYLPRLTLVRRQAFALSAVKLLTGQRRYIGTGDGATSAPLNPVTASSSGPLKAAGEREYPEVFLAQVKQLAACYAAKHKHCERTSSHFDVGELVSAPAMSPCSIAPWKAAVALLEQYQKNYVGRHEAEAAPTASHGVNQHAVDLLLIEWTLFTCLRSRQMRHHQKDGNDNDHQEAWQQKMAPLETCEGLYRFWRQAVATLNTAPQAATATPPPRSRPAAHRSPFEPKGMHHHFAQFFLQEYYHEKNDLHAALYALNRTLEVLLLDATQDVVSPSAVGDSPVPSRAISSRLRRRPSSLLLLAEAICGAEWRAATSAGDVMTPFSMLKWLVEPSAASVGGTTTNAEEAMRMAFDQILLSSTGAGAGVGHGTQLVEATTLYLHHLSILSGRPPTAMGSRSEDDQKDKTGNHISHPWSSVGSLHIRQAMTSPVLTAEATEELLRRHFVRPVGEAKALQQSSDASRAPLQLRRRFLAVLLHKVSNEEDARTWLGWMISQQLSSLVASRDAKADSLEHPSKWQQQTTHLIHFIGLIVIELQAFASATPPRGAGKTAAPQPILAALQEIWSLVLDAAIDGLFYDSLVSASSPVKQGHVSEPAILSQLLKPYYDSKQWRWPSVDAYIELLSMWGQTDLQKDVFAVVNRREQRYQRTVIESVRQDEEGLESRKSAEKPPGSASYVPALSLPSCVSVLHSCGCDCTAPQPGESSIPSSSAAVVAAVKTSVRPKESDARLAAEVVRYMLCILRHTHGPRKLEANSELAPSDLPDEADGESAALEEWLQWMRECGIPAVAALHQRCGIEKEWADALSP